MTNEYIEVVKRWQAGEHFSASTLKANADAAEDAAKARFVAAGYAAADAAAADAAYAADVAAAAYVAAKARFVAAAYDARAAADATNVAQLVKRYEELTNDK